jgi:HD-like signal output (HDOD) protein
MTTSILFVDDEPEVLHAMQRTLRGMRKDWCMEFVSSGAAALESLSRNPVDVIVSDMRMPGMDGWHLLAEVKTLYPQTVRLVLSGHADPDSVMRSVGTAQYYLAKPCECAALKAAIAQTQKLKSLLSSHQLATMVGGVGCLPSPPRSFQELLACIRDPAASLADAARIIVRDAAMTANIMKLVNSAFFGARRPLASVERAVAYLGLNTLGALVLGHGVFQSSTVSKIAASSLETLWKHSQETALAARAIALSEKQSAARAEEAFLAGLLHDVGKVVFATSVEPNKVDISQMRSQHGAVGGYLLGLWGFPNSIVEAVAFHHAPSQAFTAGAASVAAQGHAGALSLPGVVHIADRLIHRHGGGTATAADLGIETQFLDHIGLEHRLPEWTAVIATLDSAHGIP